MWENQIVQILGISALVFFNLFCIIGIIAGLSVALMAKGIGKQAKLASDKTQETLEMVQELAQESAGNSLEMISWIGTIVATLWPKKKKSLWSLFKR